MGKVLCPLNIISGTRMVCDTRCKFCSDKGECYLALLVRQAATER